MTSRVLAVHQAGLVALSDRGHALMTGCLEQDGIDGCRVITNADE